MRDLFGEGATQPPAVDDKDELESNDEQGEEEQKAEGLELDNLEVQMPSFTMGFDTTTMSAWRTSTSSASNAAAREVTYDVFTKTDDARVWAHFHDGCPVQLPPAAITKESFMSMRNSKQRGHSAGGLHWEGTHGPTRDRIWATRRKYTNGIAVLLQGDAGKMV